MSGQCRFVKRDASDPNILWYCQGLDGTPHVHQHRKEAVQPVRTAGKWVDRSRLRTIKVEGGERHG